MKPGPRIPVIMYHTVGPAYRDWLWKDLTCPPEVFADQIATLSERGYRAGTLDEVADHARSGVLPREKCVVLTFDDGYLDNWTHAYPLLKKAGWKGIVYVNPDFVEPGDEPRSTLEDVWSGRCAESDLKTHGFLNWAELEIMDREGVIQIGCHSMTHTWYATGADIEDFHRPGLDTPWLAWNAQPERKPHYLTEDQSGFVPWGTPIHANGRSLGIRRFIPDPDIGPAVTGHVAGKGGAEFFAADGWRDELLAVAREADQGRGREETDEELESRYRHEIFESRRILAAHCDHGVDHFAWPGGAYNDTSWALAEEAGYRTMTIKRFDLARLAAPGTARARRISDHSRYWFMGRIREARNQHLLADACDRELGSRTAHASMVARKAFWTLLGG